MLTPEELKIVERAKELGKTPEDAIAGIQKYRASMVKPTTTTTPVVPEKTNGFMQTAKDLGIGVLKGAGSTIKGLADMGRPIQAALDPTKTLADYNADPRGKLTEEQVTASNTTQKVGKGIEFVAEMLFPVGKVAEGIGLTTKTGASLNKLGSKIGSIGDDVVEGGVKVKDKLYELVGNLDSKTRNALKKTTKPEFDSMVDIGRKAMEVDGNMTPYEKVGNDIIAGLKQIKDRAGSIGEAKSQVMETAKVGYTKVGNIAQKSALNLQKAFSGMKLDPSDTKMIKEFQDTLKGLGNNPSLREVDAAIDLLQDRLYKAGRSNVLEISDRITGRLKSELGALNGQVKTLGGKSYAKLNKDYGDAMDIVRELNARLGKEGSNAGALIKRLFSPSDARTKELFKEMQKLTGKDYFKDARLAKFVMEALDDPRAKSLLEELPNPTNIIKGVIDYGRNKLEVPFKAAESIIKNK